VVDNGVDVIDGELEIFSSSYAQDLFLQFVKDKEGDKPVDWKTASNYRETREEA
jgi:hypothetical protein